MSCQEGRTLFVAKIVRNFYLYFANFVNSKYNVSSVELQEVCDDNVSVRTSQAAA
jgi:hypothetical protein